MLARKDKSVLQGFDQELHVKNASAAGRTVDETIEEIKSCPGVDRLLI